MQQIRRRDLGIAASVVIAAQGVGGYQTCQKLIADLDGLRNQIQELKLSGEKLTVKQADFASLNDKIDRMNEQVIQMKEQMKILKIFESTEVECDPVIFECNHDS